MTPLEVLVQAVRNRKEYQKTWEDAKAIVEKRIAAMKVSDEAKADMMSKIDEIIANNGISGPSGWLQGGHTESGGNIELQNLGDPEGKLTEVEISISPWH